MRLIAVGIVATACGSALAAYQSDGVLAGQVYTIGNAQIPIPGGQWTFVQHKVTPNNMQAQIADDVLMSIVGNQLRGFIDIATPISAPRTSYAGRRAVGGWSLLTNCGATDQYLVRKFADYYGSDQDCFVVRHLSPWPGLVTYLRQRKIAIPSIMLGPIFRFADQVNFETAQFYFNPDIVAISPSRDPVWSANGWNPQNLKRFPEKAAFIDATDAWADSWHDVLAKGFGRSLPSDFVDTTPLPNDGPAMTGAPAATKAPNP